MPRYGAAGFCGGSISGNSNCRGLGAGGDDSGRTPLERDFSLGFDGPTRPPISQPLAFDTLEGGDGALCVRHAKARAVVVAEIELADIPLQVRLAYVVIRVSTPERKCIGGPE